ncbi:MAG: hypothetical protein ACTSRT_17640 [Promethearchaeota archaeon]
MYKRNVERKYIEYECHNSKYLSCCNDSIYNNLSIWNVELRTGVNP